MSEVIGFLFSFLMSILILMVSIYAFGQVNQSARGLAARAELQDVVSRLSLGVQETLTAAGARNDSAVDTTVLRYARTLYVPQQIQGFEYELALDENFVNGSIPVKGIRLGVTTFNIAVNLPPDGICTAEYLVCSLSGEVEGSLGRIIVSYLFESAPTPTNSITIE